MPNELLIVRERFPHMGDYSGYDMLFESIENQFSCKGLWKGQYIPRFKFVRNQLLKFYPSKYISPFYSQNNFWTEIDVIKSTFFSSIIIHVLYGENNYNLLGRLSRRNKIVVTFHQPIEWWIETGIPLEIFFKNIDKLIVLSQKEKEAFEIYAPGKVSFIPHGVDTDFFRSEKAKKITQSGVMKFITVGQWLRDFDTLKDIIIHFQNHDNIEFHIVIHESKVNKHPHRISLEEMFLCKNVIWHNDISDIQLRDLYLSTDVFLLPLVDATANNAILEAMACGLPIISSNIGGISDYTDPSFVELLNKSDDFIECISNLVSNPNNIIENGSKARKFAEENFSWDIIAKKTISLYKEI